MAIAIGNLPFWAQHRNGAGEDEGVRLPTARLLNDDLGRQLEVGEMRALILALAIAGAATAANAQAVKDGQGDHVPVAIPLPTVPDGARRQAQDAIKHDLGGPASVTFRTVRAMEAASVRHGPFAERIDGPVSIVCGQYNARGPTGHDGAYAWFFVAIKQRRVLWTADDVSAGSDEAYYSCKGAGLADPSVVTGAFR